MTIVVLLLICTGFFGLMMLSLWIVEERLTRLRLVGAIIGMIALVAAKEILRRKYD